MGGLLAGPAALSVPSELDSVSNAKSVSAPGVFILAGRDEVVPLSYQNRVAEAYPGPKRLIVSPESDHSDRISGHALAEYEASLDWLLQESARR